MASISAPPKEPSPPTNEAVAAYLALWTEGLAREGLAARIAQVADEDVAFTDPFNAVRGRDALGHIITDMLDRCVEPQFAIHETALGPERAYTRWTFRFRTKKGRAIGFDGVSSLTFTAAGLCASHTDHWDSQEIYGRVPILAPMIRFIRAKLAV